MQMDNFLSADGPISSHSHVCFSSIDSTTVATVSSVKTIE